jgi:hypothetical protein
MPAPIEQDDTGAAVTPARALPPAAMQDSPWSQSGGMRTTASASRGRGQGGTVLTSPAGLIADTNSTDQRKKQLLGT